ncbi:hypothetical protein JHJ32_08255 [Parapedobacter sp. ISTM3]|uniref:SMODS-associated NUDIX domain-containing protein n=1 Tax=Parapedobacter sp. ISTM3 TaxID=2800130 RepID=UPI001902F430|nr:hypothetical protein [Parapedobacter sp. ISTM3]MBK1439973.1 hypothetical protein [Parapedobacter sp. ISTM3]
MRGKVSLVIGLLGFISCLFMEGDEPKSTVFKVSLGLVVGSLVELCVFLVENRNKWKLFKTLILKRNQSVRVTVAYLFRIEMNGKYLLIKRHKKDNPGYQPVGGAYKYLKEENRELFDRLGIEPCNHVPRDEDTENDLRIIIKRRKNLIAFLRWFESRKNREMDPTREFREELIDANLLPEGIFRHIKYVFIGKHVEGVLKSPIYPTDELRYADIYELRTENDAQKHAILDLINRNESIYFATPDEIRNGSTVRGERILPHTFKILPR